MNTKVLNKLSGEEHIYYSVDAAHDGNPTSLVEIITAEFINSLIPNGLPQHKLTLKVYFEI